MALPRYPTKNQEYIFGGTKGNKIFTVLDLKDGFWQVVLPKNYRKYFGFSILEGRNAGHYEWNLIVQGSNILVPCFQKRINEVLLKFYELGFNVYIDNIIISSPNIE